MGKSIIWYLPEKSGEVPNACSYLRLLGPLYYISNQSDFDLLELKKASDLLHPRTIGFTTNRTAAFQVPGLLDMLNIKKDSFRFIHWDTDDYSKEIDKDAKEAEYLLLLEEARKFFTTVATHITVSTEGIFKSFPSHKNVHLRRNAVPPNVWANSRNNNASEYLFFGLKAHETSLQELSEQFRRIRNSTLLESQIKVGRGSILFSITSDFRINCRTKWLTNLSKICSLAFHEEHCFLWNRHQSRHFIKPREECNEIS